jgi:hypothetical protein
MADESCIVVFPSTHFALKGERAAGDAGIAVKMIVVPRHISADCNMGMSCSEQDRGSLKGILEGEGIECCFVD